MEDIGKRLDRNDERLDELEEKLADAKVLIKTSVIKALDLAYEALQTDGAHHKQWYLEQIAIALGGHEEYIQQIESEEGIPP